MWSVGRKQVFPEQWAFKMLKNQVIVLGIVSWSGIEINVIRNEVKALGDFCQEGGLQDRDEASGFQGLILLYIQQKE